MKRWILAVAVLLACAGLASADYVIIIANLGQAKDDPSQQPGLGGFPGGIGAPGGAGAPGGIGGPGMGARGGMPGMGGMGARGGFGPPGVGGPPGMGGRGGFGRMGGTLGGPRMGGPGAGFGGGMFGDTNPDDEETPHYVVGVVEVANLPAKVEQLFALGQPIPFRHHWGSGTILKNPSSPLEFAFVKLPTVRTKYAVKHEEVFKGREKPSTEAVLGLAEWALSHSLLKEFNELMDGLEQDDKDHPAVKAYSAVKKALRRPITKEDAAASWRTRLLEGYQLFKSEHYAILHNSPTNNEVEVKSKRDLLENSYASFYYWFALKGVVLKVPEERQVVVVTKTPEDFDRYQKILSAGPPVADGYFAPREDVAVVSAERLDEKFHALDTYSAKWFKNGYDRQVLVLGKGRNGAPATALPTDLYLAQEMALLMKVMENDAERATVSHEASRQLVYASGLLPRGVAAPEWLLFGVGSFFETPLESPWPTVAAPSAAHLPHFRELVKKKKLEATPLDTLRKVVTDSYFRRPSFGQDPDAAKAKARAASWALTYFLAQKRLDGLQRYYQELAKMPRDLELDDEVLIGCFARAFGCVDANQKVDAEKLGGLAKQWFDYMQVVMLESEEVLQEIQKHFKEMRQKEENAKTGTGGASPPGAAPPGPGGGRGPGGGGDGRP